MIDLEKALASNAWPFKEAEKLLKRIQRPGFRGQEMKGGAPDARNQIADKGYVLFETGYGPSGLPHIGTFAEVFRTTLVRHAFEKISDIPTKLFAFSDDMDGLRKVPDNLPNQEMLQAHLGKALTNIPDPFGTHDSFGAHMNNRLKEFLDGYGFEYEFKSSTECYQSGMFDKALLALLKNFDAVQGVMLPTLGEERRKTYSPFMPICPKTEQVLQVPTLEVDAKKGTILYENEAGEKVETEVTGGKCKLQWKPDWGMRWAALGVDYEMHGKDLTPSVEVSSKICRAIGGVVPQTFVYEMFLDENGAKISKSKGNGLTMEEWLRYGTPESLGNFLYANPKKARKLYFGEIPKSVDEYLTHLGKVSEQEDEKKFANPAWHIHNGDTPEHDLPITYGLLLNLASACNPEDASVLWGFIEQYAEGANAQNHPYLNELVIRAIRYYEDFVKPNKKYRAPTEQEHAAMADLAKRLEEYGAQSTEHSKEETLPPACGGDRGGEGSEQKLQNSELSTKDKDTVLHSPHLTSPRKREEGQNASELQNIVFAVGNDNGFENLREWFGALYEVLLGQSQGPRMGSFIALYGVEATISLINRALKGEDLAEIGAN
jgi:lysyl-tRNA synthetase class 1